MIHLVSTLRVIFGKLRNMLTHLRTFVASLHMWNEHGGNLRCVGIFYINFGLSVANKGVNWGPISCQ